MSGKFSALIFCALFSRAPTRTGTSRERRSGKATKATVRQLLQYKTNVNAAQPDGMTALHWAATRDDVPLAKMLLAAGAQASPKTRLGDLTPLFIASKRGNAPMIEALLKAGANANATDSTGATPLMLASSAGSAEAVEILLAHQADVNAKESARQQTALMFAAAADRGAVIRTTHQAWRGTRKSHDHHIQTPECGSLFANSFCLEAAQSKYKPAPETVSQENDGEDQPPAETPPTKTAATTPPRRRKGPAIIGGMTSTLLYAARDERHRSRPRALIEAGAKIDNPGTGEKMTPLVMAIVNGHYDHLAHVPARIAEQTPISPATKASRHSTPRSTRNGARRTPTVLNPSPAEPKCRI